MGNVKELAQKDAMQRVDKVIEKLLHGIIKRDDAVRAIRKIPNIELVIDRSNIEDHVDEAIGEFKLEQDDPIPTTKGEQVLTPPKDTNHCVVKDCTHEWGGDVNDEPSPKVKDRTPPKDPEPEEDDDFIKEFERTRG